MYKKLADTISAIIPVHNINNISEERKTILQPLIDFVQQKADDKQEININFICTHNSRRSHLAQVCA